MAKKSDRNEFIDSIKEEIRSELMVARLSVRKAQEDVSCAWKKVQAIKSDISFSKRRLKTLERTYLDRKGAKQEIASLQRRLVIIQQRIEDLQDLQDNPITMDDIKAIKAKIAMDEAKLLKKLAEHEDAQWRLEQAKANLEEVRLDTAAEKRLWWDEWDGSIEDMLD